MRGDISSSRDRLAAMFHARKCSSEHSSVSVEDISRALFWSGTAVSYITKVLSIPLFMLRTLLNRLEMDNLGMVFYYYNYVTFLTGCEKLRDFDDSCTPIQFE